MAKGKQGSAKERLDGLLRKLIGVAGEAGGMTNEGLDYYLRRRRPGFPTARREFVSGGAGRNAFPKKPGVVAGAGRRTVVHAAGKPKNRVTALPKGFIPRNLKSSKQPKPKQPKTMKGIQRVKLTSRAKPPKKTSVMKPSAIRHRR